ncbi:baseplate assembly protein [Oleidesulfovibrio sp.]|uniref:baseplate assembly protein n=1 Tax=Oleidesulfovibrio sp. TaxID=2909707 RepID=UPI003A88FB52
MGVAVEEDKSDVLDLLRQAIEFAMPDLRHYLRPVKKGKVVAVYASDGNYFCDVQPLRNDEAVDEKEPVISKVEIPVLWGGPDRGVVCPPVVGVHCDITYYDGDPNYPRISNFRWHGMNAPKADLNEFIIQLEPGVSIHIDKEKQVVTLTPENVNTEAGKNWTVKAGDNAQIEAGKDATVNAKGGEVRILAATLITLAAPLINILGRLICKSFTGSGKGYAEFEGDVVIRGNEEVKGNTATSGNATVGGSSTVAGNSQAGTRSGGTCPHTC